MSEEHVYQELGWRTRYRKRIETFIDLFSDDRLGQFGLAVLLLFIVLAIFTPIFAPYGPEQQFKQNGRLVRMAEPSLKHPFGTTFLGRDIFSQTIRSTRVSMLVGSLSAFIAVAIGTNVGLVSGYYGGKVDNLLMRITDITYGIPLLPFVIVLVAILGPSLVNVIVAISLIQWRVTARVIRSQVLSMKERPYIESAEAIGSSDLRIIYLHLLPNVLPLSFLYAAFTVGWAVIAQANVSFLGYGDPKLFSWGKMIFQAYSQGVIRQALWWVLPPAISIMLLVMSVFFVGRTLEKHVNPELRQR